MSAVSSEIRHRIPFDQIFSSVPLLLLPEIGLPTGHQVADWGAGLADWSKRLGNKVQNRIYERPY